ncbi:Cytosolic copper metallochaperone [Microbotryomycetes sp. JL221]|nr:Cytosolic copper metallochaperone [Microbotryomycetes sp. JL221]
MAESQYQFDVVMTCSGCSGAIERVLKKTEGVSSYNVSLPEQSVTVNTTVPYDDILAKIKKTGKQVKGGKVVSGPTPAVVA